MSRPRTASTALLRVRPVPKGTPMSQQDFSSIEAGSTEATGRRQIRFNAFDMNCVGHQSPGLWRHPEDRSANYTDLSYWAHLARTCEKGLFDGIFIADVLGTYDVYGNSNEATLRQGTQVPVNDPLLLVSAMALVTEHLGFGVTAGTAYEHPYPFARRLSTLDHLTKGRVGWNVVTGYLPSAARNMGAADQLEHDERYNHADEYLEVIYKLLEGSWEDDAVVRDRETGVFTDPTKVHDINHEGKYFTVPGIHISEPSPQRTPVIYQAGASPRGVAFAAGNAEAVFVGASTIGKLKATVSRIRDAAEAAGRDRHSIRIYTLLTIITAATAEEAEACFSASACKIWDSLSACARRILDSFSPSATRIADFFSPSACKIFSRRSRSAFICFSIASRIACGGR